MRRGKSVRQTVQKPPENHAPICTKLTKVKKLKNFKINAWQGHGGVVILTQQIKRGVIQMTITIQANQYKTNLEKMLTDVIRKYGYEHDNTIKFAGVCEKYEQENNYATLHAIRNIYAMLIK